MIVSMLLVHDDTNDDEDYDDVCDEQKYRAQKKVVEKELRDLTVEHELHLAGLPEEERQHVLKRQRESILDIQQRSGPGRRFCLQKKLAAVTETLEKKEAQLCAALSVCSIEPTVRSNRRQQAGGLAEEEEGTAAGLNYTLSPAAQLPVSAAQLVTSCMFDLQEYEQLRHSWKEQLKASGGSLHDFPFRPAKKILKDAGSDQ
ncbi:hypothetical protein CRENBAI_007101 [Crenichthys baileyi]|uniref:Dynein regulatory complex subunit 4 n=1 Tax=Crenichthys baileyi TaxID=28760 RepID=A0AAV9S8E6_9TELE